MAYYLVLPAGLGIIPVLLLLPPSAAEEKRGCGDTPIGANLSDRLSGTGGKAGDEGEASSPLHDGTSIGTVPSCRGELASPVCSTRTEALKFAPMGDTPRPGRRASRPPAPPAFPVLWVN